MDKNFGPKTEFADMIHSMKYRGKGETFRAQNDRVAGRLTDSDEDFQALREITGHQRFLFAGRVQASVGSTRSVTPFNCYVSGEIADSFVHGPGNIMERATEAAATMRMGGGIGYDFSTLRPQGELIKKLHSASSGPLSFMKIFNEIGLCVASAGHRRGAQMGVMRVDHPDIEQFILAKQDGETLTGFNISVGITDKFMEAVNTKSKFDLVWGGQVYATVDAQDLWETIMRSTWDWAEPGVLFIDRINDMNNLKYCETIAATNPCGEQPLPPFGACLLGSFNLVKYLYHDTLNNNFTFDYKQLRKDIPRVVKAMDNIIDIARYPLPQQRIEAHNKRRMGIGITGLANAALALGWDYATGDFLAFQVEVLRTIAEESYKASARLAAKRGAFPKYVQEEYLKSEFLERLDCPEVVDLIRKNGIRNSHLTSIAPTGTISMAADNVSSGIEPVIQLEGLRPINTPDGPRQYEVFDWAYVEHGLKGKEAAQVTAKEHVDVLCAAQHYVDSAVSKTCNVSGDMKWEDFKSLYIQAWRGGAKGCTTFNADGKRMSLFKSKPEKEAACTVDENGRKECS